MAKLLYYSSLCFVLVIFLCDFSNHTLYPPSSPLMMILIMKLVTEAFANYVSLRKLTTGAEN